VPHRLTAESLVAGEPGEAEVQAVVEAPVRVHRAPATEWLREQTLDLLGARTTLVDGEPLGQAALPAPPTRLDPSDVAVQEQPIGAALTTSYERPPGDPGADGANASADVEAIAEARDPLPAAGASLSDARLVPPGSGQTGGQGSSLLTSIPPVGLTLAGLGILLMIGGVAGWRRHELRSVTIPSAAAWSALRHRVYRSVTLPSLTALTRRLPKRR
jgi:hypothetical protein